MCPLHVFLVFGVIRVSTAHVFLVFGEIRVFTAHVFLVFGEHSGHMDCKELHKNKEHTVDTLISNIRTNGSQQMQGTQGTLLIITQRTLFNIIILLLIILTTLTYLRMLFKIICHEPRLQTDYYSNMYSINMIINKN